MGIIVKLVLSLLTISMIGCPITDAGIYRCQEVCENNSGISGVQAGISNSMRCWCKNGALFEIDSSDGTVFNQ